MKANFLPAAWLITAVLHAGAPFAAVESKAPSQWEFLLGTDAGWRHEHFEWTIAGDLSGRHPNILSDLDWRNLNIVMAHAGAEITFRKNWHLFLGGGYGWIVSGGNRDSDYDFNNRRGEYSRSTADTRGGTVDADALLGYDFNVSRAVTLTPGAGFTYHRMRLNDRNGIQVIDTDFHDVGPFGGLDSEYSANWWGAAVGVGAKVRLSEKWRWLTGVRYELLRYHGSAFWNLRRDFVNFQDTANGQGWLLTTGVEWDFAARWSFALLGEYACRRTGAGTDDTLFNDNSHELTRFNRAVWESFGVRAMVRHRF